VWFLQNVWPKVRERYVGANFSIVGANPPSALQELNGQNGIRVTGWVNDVRPFLQDASVFVAPIFDGGGLRGKVLEAWAMQRPGVGTRLAFEGLTSEDGTICFIADDADTFARRTCELLENQGLASRIGERARGVVLDRFSWDTFGDMYDVAYNQILGTKRQSAVLERESKVEFQKR
jgi:glycosyltransferase involved in cell wall biosynthesis